MFECMNKQDLLEIKAVIVEVIEEHVPRIFDEKFSSIMEHNLIPQFDLIHSRIDSVEVRLGRVENKLDSVEKKMDTQMASKGFVEERLDKFANDHRLVFKPAT